MSRKYKIRDQTKPYFVTLTIVQWVDVFTRNEYRNIFIDSLRYCIANKGLEVYAYCMMTNHVHLIIGTHGEDIQAILRDLKKFTSVKIIKAIEDNQLESRKHWMLWIFRRSGEQNPNNEKYQFWLQHNHPIEIQTIEVAMQRLQYIHENPVKAGFVSEPEAYLYSSAGDYSGRKGLLDIDFLY